METYNVTLPSGKLITNVPVGTTQEVLKDKLIASGRATLSDFEIADKPPVVPTETTPVEETVRRRGSTVGTTGKGTSIEDVGQYLKEHMEIPGSVVGSMGGALTGSVLFPGVGTVAGAVLGGALGAGGGSLLSDELTGEDLDYYEAVKEAALTAGFDIATLGLGKGLKAGYFASRKAFGFTPEETLSDITKNVTTSAGTTESLKRSQQILEKGGATLTPFQVGVKGISNINEKIGRIGILSASDFEKNATRINEIVSNEIDNVVTRYLPRVDGSSEDIAEALFSIVKEGQKASIDTYGDNLELLKNLVSKERVPVGSHVYRLNNYVSRNMGERISDLSDETLDFIDNNLRPLLGNNMGLTLPAKELISLDKKITSEISQKFGVKSANPNSQVEMELSILADELSNTTISVLRKVNPEAAKKYSSMKKEYSSAKKGLLPEINETFVKQAKKGNYKSLGNLLATVGNERQTLAFIKSLKKGFSEVEKRGVKNIGPFIAYDEAEALLKKNFLQKVFPNAGTPEFNINDYKNLAKNLEKKDVATKYKLILGKDYPQVKQLINLMAEASTKPESTMGELALRSKEVQALALIGVSGGSLPVGLAALALPKLAASVALNPANVRKVLEFEKRKFLSPEQKAQAWAVVLNDIVSALPEEDQAEIRNEQRGL